MFPFKMLVLQRQDKHFLTKGKFDQMNCDACPGFGLFLFCFQWFGVVVFLR